MSANITKKIYTDNPFVDSLLYYVKILAYGSVIKLQSMADKAETDSSLTKSDLYLLAYENSGSFDLFSYNEDVLSQSSVPASKVSAWAANNSLIEDKYKDELLALERTYYIAHYDEENSYYRMIIGLPPIGDYGIPIKNYEYLVPEGNDLGNATYIHELGAAGCRMLDGYGILDIIKADYPDAEYLNYITCGISLYKARKSFDYQILYSPSCGVIEIDEKFATKYSENRIVMIKTMYSDAMGIQSSYYDNFMAFITMMMTIADMLTEVQEHMIKKDIIDARCIEYLFSVYGIPYYRTIPLKYQTRMIKRVNDLVRYKSCAQGMLNLITIFGCEDIEVFKYYLLRERKRDYWGDYVYNVTNNVTSKYNDIVLLQHTEKPSTNLTIPYPFTHFLQKGNVMFVRLDNHRLVENVDYEIYNYDQIRFLNGVDVNKRTIQYDFYYDKNTINQEFIPNTEDGITMITKFVTPSSDTFTYDVPYADYFNDGNQIIISCDGVFIPTDGYTINRAGGTITIDSTYKVAGKEVVLIYLYGKKYTTKFLKVDVEAYVDNQTVFTIPEPFKNYTINGNCFFITIGSTYIDSRRYDITNGQIVLKDTKIKLGRKVAFNFIYSTASVYTSIDLMHTVQTIKATNDFQYVFPVNYPLDNYLNSGYNVYVKLKGWFLPLDYYDYYTGKIVLRNHALALHAGETFELHFIYGPMNDNLIVTHQSVVAQTPYQATFDIKLPLVNFFEKGNKVIADVDGYPLIDTTDYYYNSDHTQITITNKDLLPYKGGSVNFTMVYNQESDYAVKIQTQTITASSDGQKSFFLNLPFYPYLQTTQGFLVIHKSRIVNPELISTNEYTITLDLDTIEMGDDIVIVYIFNNKYQLNRLQLLTVKEITVPLHFTLDSDLVVDIPVPFDDYLENYWPYFVDHKMDKVDKSLFEEINNGMLFINPRDVLNYDSFTFVFVYKDSYLNIDEEEDYTKDIDLRFSKVPLESKHPLDYIKQSKQTKSYDSVTLDDKFWDGEDNQDNAHEAIKLAILKRQFNYARTKYMTLEYMIDLSDMVFQTCYFYNMLYDDVFREDLLTVNVPTISANKQFKIVNLFIYMTALAYNYSGIKDKVMDTPTKIMYVKGFNFKADLAALKQYVRDNRRRYQDFDFDTFMIPMQEIPDMATFIEIYRNNKTIYQTIVKGMAEANNYDIYKIWKTLYESLMTWKFNLEFFKLSDGTIAKTLSAFLKEKDNVLYMSLEAIKAISDKETRENEIVTVISDIVYILEEYIDSKEFKYIYLQFPGVSGEYVLQYLFTMINFFKSYKVILKEMNVNLTIDDPYENMIRPNDKQAMLISLVKPDYIGFKEVKHSNVRLEKKETIGFTDKVSFNYYGTK